MSWPDLLLIYTNKFKNSKNLEHSTCQQQLLFYEYPQKGQPHVLAVDLGCGTGQITRILAPYFQEVVGIDVSKAQLETARAVPGYSNISYK